MNRRNAFRYESEQLPEVLRVVQASWSCGSRDSLPVVELSPAGMRMLLSDSAGVPVMAPDVNEMVTVKLATGVTISGQCIHMEHGPGDSITIGISIVNSIEQEYLYDLLMSSPIPARPTIRFVTHQFEELVMQLCESENPLLREIGLREAKSLNAFNG